MKDLNQTINLISALLFGAVALYFLVYGIALAIYKAKSRFPARTQMSGDVKNWHINVAPGTPVAAIEQIMADIDKVISAREAQGRSK